MSQKRIPMFVRMAIVQDFDYSHMDAFVIAVIPMFINNTRDEIVYNVSPPNRSHKRLPQNPIREC